MKRDRVRETGWERDYVIHIMYKFSCSFNAVEIGKCKLFKDIHILYVGIDLVFTNKYVWWFFMLKLHANQIIFMIQREILLIIQLVRVLYLCVLFLKHKA